jgi:hypothetical protein
LSQPNLFPDPQDPDAWRTWADALLAPMDLSVGLLHQVAEAGQRKMDATSPLAPKITGGTNRWSEMVIALRNLTGWQLDETDGLPRTVHPSGRFYVVVRTGAEGVGRFGQCPTPKSSLGPVLQLVVDEVPSTTPLFDLDGKPTDADAYVEPELWFFLTDYRDGLIYSELSRPSSREGEMVTGYYQQIQVPPFSFGPFGLDDLGVEPDDGPDDFIGPQIEVQPR